MPRKQWLSVTDCAARGQQIRSVLRSRPAGADSGLEVACTERALPALFELVRHLLCPERRGGGARCSARVQRAQRCEQPGCVGMRSWGPESLGFSRPRRSARPRFGRAAVNMLYHFGGACPAASAPRVGRVSPRMLTCRRRRASATITLCVARFWEHAAVTACAPTVWELPAG